MYYSIVVTETGTELTRTLFLDEAIKQLEKYEDEDIKNGVAFMREFYSIKQILTKHEQSRLKELIKVDFFKKYTGLKICDVNIIDSYEPNEYIIKILVVDKLHTPMYYKFTATINDKVELVDMEFFKLQILH